MLQIRHKSDCALHNAPAYESKPCDCGGEKIMLDSLEMVIKRGEDLLKEIEAQKGIIVASVDFKVWLNVIKDTLIPSADSSSSTEDVADSEIADEG